MRVWNREVALSLALAIAVGLMSGCVGSVGPANDQNQPPVAPQITTQPADQSVLAGATATFTVAATGTAPLDYQWQENGAAINGATSASYTTPPMNVADNNAQFQVVVSNTAGSVTSRTAVVTVGADPVPPNVTSQPASTSVTAGQSASFSVVASGTAPLGFQWQKNNAPINGATSASYTTPPTTSSDNGATFRAVVTNTAGSVTSSPATLTVNTAAVAPSISTQPASTSVTAGQSASFSVVATGTAPLSYQWQKNNAPIGGANSSSYTTPATTAGDDGSTFSVVVSNTAGTITSSSATLTVTAATVAPGISTPPANQTVNVGQTATFSVTATGTAPLSYQWMKNGTSISGAISATYTTPATAATDSGALFAVTVSNTAGTITSGNATLTVQVPPSITTPPANQTVNAGQTASFSVVAAGTAPLSYQWQKNNANISGATAASYTTPATTGSDNSATFRVVVSNAAGTVTSSAATLTVQTAPSISTQPAGQTVNVGQTATFSVVAAGTAPLNYQWQKNNANISGATAASYTTPATTAADNASTFRVTVSNVVGNATSSTVNLTVQSPPAITTPPTSTTVTAGQTANFSVTAAGTSPLSYQWQKNGANISGATSSSYTTPVAKTSDNGASFVVNVTNPAGNISSGAAILTVNADTTPPSVSITSPITGSTVGGTISITATASDNIGVASVQLQVDGANSGSADTASPYNFSLDTTTLTNANHTLTAVATDTSGNQATSAGISITVANQSASATPGYAGNGAGCPINTVPGGPSDSVTSYNCPLPNPTGAGNLLVLLVRYANPPSQNPTFSDNVGGNTYSLATSCVDSGNNTAAALYYAANVNSGVNVVTTHFGSSTTMVQMDVFEFYNVATSAVLDGAHCQVGSGTSVSSGAIPALSGSGDLVMQFGVGDSGKQIGGCSTGSQANISWQMRMALIAGPEPACGQYGVYNSTASFSPTFGVNTSISYVSVAAAFRSESAGTPPPGGIRVVYVQHDDGSSEENSSFSAQLPISGNLIAELTSAGCASNTVDTCNHPTSMSDGTNNWTIVGGQYLSAILDDGRSTVGSIWYAKNVQPGLYSLSVATNAVANRPYALSYIMYDISGASTTSPLDLGFGGNGNGLAAVATNSTSTAPIVTFTATPSGPNEVTLAQAGYDYDTFLGLTSPAGAQFLSSTYISESNPTWDDLNGGWGLFYNGNSTAAQTWTWTHDNSNQVGSGRGIALGVAFQGP
jgi:hypothetical protein